MLIDRPQVVEGSVIVNATVPSGTSFPSSPNAGELFFRTDLGSLQTFTGALWVEAGSVSLATHIADQTLHLTSVQNTLLDGLDPALTSTELNFVHGVTSPIQTQIAAASGNFTSHINDDTRHLTAAENTLIDAIGATAAEINYTIGTNAPIQGQINTINALDGVQNARLTTLENTTVPQVQTNLNTHAADDTRHLTAAQNTLIDAITVSAADINKLGGAAGLTSSIKLSLDALAGNDYSSKISANGSIGMSGNLSLGGNRITGLATPIALTDAATKDYVDSFAQGLHWVGSVLAASTGNLVLSGLQTVDGVALSNSSRVLVKDQNAPAENGIYLAAAGAWSRANDFNGTDPLGQADTFEINNAAVFVLAGGTQQGKSTWVQTSTVNNLGSDPITWSAFSGPVINQAGSGVTLGSNGLVSVKEGAGLAFDGNNALIADVYLGGGLMLTTNNTTAATLTTTAAQLALTQTGVAAGSYGSATQASSFTVDAKGRLTAASATTITPAFSSITGTPTTLAGYGITNAVNKGGDTITGNVNIFPPSGIAAFAVTRATAATGQTTINLVTASGAGAGTWQLYNQTGSSNFAIYSSILGSDILQLTTSGSANFTGTVQATSFIGNVTGNAATVNMSAGRGDSTAYPVLWGTTGSTSQLYSASSVTIQSSTGTLNAINFAGTGQANFQGNQASGIGTSAGALGGIMVQGPGGGTAAFMSFHRPGAYAAYLGIDTDNQWKVGGWSMGANAYPILHSANYNSYSPTLTGGGASGTWSINVTGNAGNANTVAGYSPSVGVVGSTLVLRDGNGYTFGNYFNSTDNSQASGVSAIMVKAGDNYFRSGTAAAVASFVGPSITSLGNIATIAGFSPTNQAIRFTPNFHLNASTGNAVILNWDNGGSGAQQAVRIGNGAGVDAWYCTHGGATVQTGSVSAGQINSSATIFGVTLSTATAGQGYVNLQRGGGNSGYVEFMAANANRQGYIGYASTTGGTDSGTLNYVAGFHAFNGPISSTGDVSAFSDRRLKKDIEPILEPLDKIERLEGVTFKRIKDNTCGTGLIAQDVQAVMPNAVIEHEDGMLSVAYGNLAGLFVEAIKALNKEVAELRAELNSLKDKQ